WRRGRAARHRRPRTEAPRRSPSRRDRRARGAPTSATETRPPRRRARAAPGARGTGPGAAARARSRSRAARRPACAGPRPPRPLRPGPTGRPIRRERAAPRAAPTPAPPGSPSRSPVVEPAHVALLAAPHGGAGPPWSPGMVVAEDVQGAVHGEANELRGDPFPLHLSTAVHPAAPRPRTEIHVAQNRAVGLTQRERDHIGESATAGGPAVEASHRGAVEQGEVHSRAVGPLPGEHPSRDARQARRQCGVTLRSAGPSAARSP